MSHYICEGECGGVSDQPGVCQTEGCSRHSQPLVECRCENADSHEMHETHDHTNPDAESQEDPVKTEE